MEGASRELFADSTLLVQSLYLGPDTLKNGITHDLRESRWYPLRHRLDSDGYLGHELLDDGFEVLTHTVDFGHPVPMAPLNSGNFVVCILGAHRHRQLHFLPLK